MRAEPPALSPVARIVLAIAIGVVALLVPACGGSGAGEDRSRRLRAQAAGEPGGLDRLDSAGVALKVR